MMTQTLATGHRQARQRLIRNLVAEGRRLWWQVDPDDLRSWAVHAGRLLVLLAGAQAAAAGGADDYVDEALELQDLSVAALGAVNARRFAGVASDGRPLQSLLQQPVIATKTAIARGATMPRAMAGGDATLRMILRTQVADAGRVADGVAIAARPGTGYVRMLVGKTCPRCMILAGRFYRYSSGFQRHPRCDCFHMPAKGEQAARDDGLITDPRAHFDTLTAAEQDTAFGKAGAQAIRDGADMGEVVNARRGMTAAGTTTEGTARRGLASVRLGGGQRLMPEELYQLASDRDEALQLLRSHGYLI